MKKRLVIAKYNEDTTWVEESPIRPCLDFIKYNKMNDLKEYSSFIFHEEKNIDLFNAGREAHTYLWHIVNNYEKLYDVEIFTQGEIRDTLDIVEFWKSVDSISDETFSGFLEFSPTLKQIAFDESYLGDLKSMFPRSIHLGYFGEVEREFFHKIYQRAPVGKYYQTSAHSIFAVSRNVIQRHPKEKYEKLLSICDPKISSSDNITSFPYQMEHFWSLLFKHPLD